MSTQDSALPNDLPPAYGMHDSPTKFLVCVDKSETSRTALRFACIKAKKRGGVVDILHVIEPSEFQSIFSISDQIQQDKHSEAEELLLRLSEEAATMTGILPTVLRRDGSVGPEILKAAVEDQGVNMLVIGVAPGQTKGKLVQWLCQQLGQDLIMPILLVPGNLTEAQMEELA